MKKVGRGEARCFSDGQRDGVWRTPRSAAKCSACRDSARCCRAPIPVTLRLPAMMREHSTSGARRIDVDQTGVGATFPLRGRGARAPAQQCASSICERSSASASPGMNLMESHVRWAILASLATVCVNTPPYAERSFSPSFDLDQQSGR